MIKSFKSLLTKSSVFRSSGTLATAPISAKFHNSNTYSKKLSIGEALVVLEEKVSKISQLVWLCT